MQLHHREIMDDINHNIVAIMGSHGQ